MRTFLCSALALGLLASPMAALAKPSKPDPKADSAKGDDTKKKGSEAGRMCGKDSDCRSGTCKMENKTRGRCK